MADIELAERLTAIEHQQSRFVLATEGHGGIVNLVESRLVEERALLTEVVAALQREFEATWPMPRSGLAVGRATGIARRRR